MSPCGKLKLVLIVTRCGKREWNSGFNDCNCGNKLDKWRRITIIQAMYDNCVDKLGSVVLI